MFNSDPHTKTKRLMDLIRQGNAEAVAAYLAAQNSPVDIINTSLPSYQHRIPGLGSRSGATLTPMALAALGDDTSISDIIPLLAEHGGIADIGTLRILKERIEHLESMRRYLESIALEKKRLAIPA